MVWNFPNYTWLLVISGAFSLMYAIVGYLRRSAPGARYFILLMLAMAWWSFGQALEVGIVSRDWKITFSTLQWLGIAFTPALLLAFVLNYTGLGTLLTPRRKIALYAIPVMAVIIVFTNPLHGLQWVDIRVGEDPYNLEFTHGPWFPVFTVYSYIVIMAVLLALTRLAIQRTGIYRWQAISLLVACLIPVGGNMAYLLGITLIRGMDMTPVLFTLTGLIITLTFFRFRLLDIGPMARDVLFESLLDGVLVFDREQRLVDFNPAALRLLNLPKLALGQPLDEALSPLPDLLAMVRSTPRDTVAQPLELALPDTDIVLEVHISPVPHTGAHLIILRDATEHQRAMKQALNFALEHERVQMLTRFLRDASHEFRTPLSIITTSLYLIRHFSDPAQRNEQIDKINKQVHQITALLEDMSVMMQLETNPFFEQAPVDINPLLLLGEKKVRATLSDDDREITFELDDDLPLIHGDRAKLQRAFEDLLQNALMYTPLGTHIRVRTSSTPEHVVVEFSDDGPGLTDEVRARLFERFFRGDAAHSTPGFGLGLSIVKSIIEGHGGRIEVESAPQQGTTFRLFIPRKQPPRVSERPMDASTLRDLRETNTIIF